MRHTRLLFTLLGGLVAATGCSGGRPVPVVVTLDGAPVGGATVTLQPTEDRGQSASGFTESDGTATLTCPGDKGVPSGTYKVLVTKAEPVQTAIDPENPRDAMMKEQKGKQKLTEERPRDKMMEMMRGKAGGGGPRPQPGKPKPALPEAYGNFAKTPLTLTIPPESSPAKIELRSNP